MLNFNEDKTQLDAGINFRDVTIMKNDNDQSRSDNFFVLFNPFYDNSINMPVPYLNFKLPQIKFKNDQ